MQTKQTPMVLALSELLAHFFNPTVIHKLHSEQLTSLLVTIASSADTLVGGDSLNYFYRSRTLETFITNSFGQPSKAGTDPGDFKGLTGIIEFTPYFHGPSIFDIWDGSNCKHQCLFSDAQQVVLWQFK